MPIVIAEFKDKLTGTVAETEAQSSICILPISVGQPYHTGTAWDETIALINTKFSACIIVVADGLHRHTEMMKNSGLLESEARELAVKTGDAWVDKTNNTWQKRKIKKTQGLNSFLTIPYVMTRWSDWTNTEYEEKKIYIDEMYANGLKLDLRNAAEKKRGGTVELSQEDKAAMKFQSYVDVVRLKFVSGFLAKEEKKHKHDDELVGFNLDIANELSKNYLLEELAFVAMCRDRAIPSIVRSVMPPELLESSKSFFMAYPFGQCSLNTSIFNCFGSLCSENFKLLNLCEETLIPQDQSKSSSTVIIKKMHAKKILTDRQFGIVSVPISTRDKQIQTLHSADNLHYKVEASIDTHDLEVELLPEDISVVRERLNRTSASSPEVPFPLDSHATFPASFFSPESANQQDLDAAEVFEITNRNSGSAHTDSEPKSPLISRLQAGIFSTPISLGSLTPSSEAPSHTKTSRFTTDA